MSMGTAAEKHRTKRLLTELAMKLTKEMEGRIVMDGSYTITDVEIITKQPERGHFSFSVTAKGG